MLVKFNFSQNSRTRTTPIAGHLTVVSACSGGHLTNYFFKSQIPRGLPGGGGLIAVGFDSYIKLTHGFVRETRQLILATDVFIQRFYTTFMSRLISGNQFARVSDLSPARFANSVG